VNELQHRPVLLEEVLAGLNLRPDGIYIDATFGRGGHADALLARLGPEGRLFAIDRDPQAVEAGRARFRQDRRFTITRGRFSMLADYVEGWAIAGQVNGIVIDLGVSSPQLEDAGRGFSFRQSGPLDMRMDPDAGISAADWVNTTDEDMIAETVRRLGEERFAKRVARAIARTRAATPFVTTAELADVVRAAVPTREPGKDPATRTFQAIRMVVNQELEELERILPRAVDALAPAGRLAVISFHSLEDRLVKHFMRNEAQGPPLPKGLPIREHERAPRRLKVVGRAIRPSETETRENPRARSAVLRIAERTEADRA
jgi:16S rRNA (cytosine1402-N4)-methyltransferase